MPNWTSCWSGMGWGMGGFGGLFMIFFWALIIIGAVLIVRWMMEQSGGGRSKSALDILRERYARGEIQKEEYEEKKRELTA